MPAIAAAASAAPALVRGALARGLRLDPVVPVSVWAARHRRVPIETSQFPGPWSNETAPYLTEIMDHCGPDHPAPRVTIKKAAQIGYSEALTNMIGCAIDIAPGPAMIVHPTVEAGKNWVAEKLDSTIAATPVLRRKVRTVISRDADGSTSKRKRFPGGYLVTTGANSTRELRQRSVRYLYKDDWSDWPLDIDGQGDPDKMAEARTRGFESSGLVKIVEGSTPTDLGICRTTAAYEKSDKRVYLVPCPECAHEQALHFWPDSAGKGGLRFNEAVPFDARYACEACGVLIGPEQKRAMVAKGRWQATAPGPGRHPGFHVNSLISPFTTWDNIAQRYLEARGERSKLKVWTNLDLGEPWEERGDAPDWKHLADRAEDYPTGRLPAGALLVTIGVDVQKEGVYYEIVAWGRGRESWSIGAEFIPGETGDPGSPVWKALDQLYQTRFAIADGEPIRADMMAVDANYNTDQVCEFVRGRPLAMAVRGMYGWERRVFGEASRSDVTYAGVRRKRSAKIWPVFVWNLKGELYASLRKLPSPGEEALPAGYCHFPSAYAPIFFQQLTADHLKEVERRGRRRLEWTSAGANHFHDCRIYAMAAFHRAALRFGLEHGAGEGWARLERDRRPGRPQADLPLDRESAAGAPPAAPAAGASPPAFKPRGGYATSWR